MAINNPTFKELKKQSKITNGPTYKMAILGDSSTQYLNVAIRGYASLSGYALDIFEADYNTISYQIMDEQSELYNHSPNFILLSMCTEKLYEKYCNTPLESRSSFYKSVIDEIESYWSIISSRLNTKIIQFLFVPYKDNIFGSFANKVESSFDYQLRKINWLLCESSVKTKNVYLIDLESLVISGVDKVRNNKNYYTTKMTLSLEILPFVAKTVSDIINVVNGKIKKCIILDLDGTVWGGIIGDDGLEGIQIGELGLGPIFTDLQRWFKELKNRGVLIAICSKNEENVAKEPFIKHPDMILRLDDISIFVANWNDKATNIRYIQKVLNIGMDSMVFIDDNPYERNLVKSQIPEITVPDLPGDPADYLEYIKSLNLFETASYSIEDVNRTKQYQAEANRVELEHEFKSYDDYLIGLKMKARCGKFDDFRAPRIAQLTQRSNQFNLRTVRYTENDISRIMDDERYITLYIELEDQFGDYGLIGVIIMERNDDEKKLFITEWLMSCRVLKRGVEEFIVNKIVDIAKTNGYDKVVGEYIETPKNRMVSKIYPDFGFNPVKDNLYEIDVAKYKNKKTFVKEV